MNDVEAKNCIDGGGACRSRLGWRALILKSTVIVTLAAFATLVVGVERNRRLELMSRLAIEAVISHACAHTERTSSKIGRRKSQGCRRRE